MEAQAQRKPEAGDGGGTEAEDIPSDFFDDFNKDDFIEGLSVIDSWDDKEKERNSKSDRPRFTAEVFEKVRDLRELMSHQLAKINDEKSREDGLRDYKVRREDSRDDRTRGEASRDDKHNSLKNEPLRQRRSSSISRLDEFIKPGSRRDPNKTIEAIKRDKEEKVKEFLAKSLESSADDLRPPGTELDDYFEGNKLPDKKPGTEPLPQKPRSRSRDRRRESPRKQQYRRSPKWSPKRSPIRRRPSRSPKRSPRRMGYTVWRPNSPPRNPGYKRFNKRYSPARERYERERREYLSPRRSPRRQSPRRQSPRRQSPRRQSPRRQSPRHSPRSSRHSRSRSPYRRQHRSSSNRDNFLYPPETELPRNYPPPAHYQVAQQYGPSSDYQSGPSPSGYPTYAPAYGGYNAPYDYGGAPMPVPQPVPMNPVPAPVPNPVPPPTPSHSVLPVPSPIPPPAVHIPAMVPAPSMVPPMPHVKQADVRTPYDALAKLVAEGKISKADYLKLAPNKGPVCTSDDKNRVMVLNRCSSALVKLNSLDLPNQLLFNHAIKLGPEPKYIAPKFCSPLKRQAPVQFQFTSPNGPSNSQQNKHLIDSIIAAVGLEKVISRPKKKTPKNMKDAACQTTKPYCDVCEIRDATTSSEVGTSIDLEHFHSTVHTQVVEQDLVSSKSVFNPSGSVGDGASISIAHLTPAQLVSQLAARAKTLKNPEPPSNQYRRNQDYNYDYDNRGGQNQQYQNYNNYRY